MTDECVYLVVTAGIDTFRVLKIFKSEDEAEQYIKDEKVAMTKRWPDWREWQSISIEEHQITESYPIQTKLRPE